MQRIGRMRGRGQVKTMPKRGVCPACGKRGMGQPKPNPYGHKPMLQRACQYCAHVATEILS